MRASKDITVIAMTDSSRAIADATPLRCVTAKPLISKADDAETQTTQDSGPTFPGRFRKGEATPRDSGRRTTATARRRVRPHQAFQTASCGRRNPLIPNDATASDRTDRKKRPSIYFFGAWAITIGRVHPVTGVEGSLLRACNCLLRCNQAPNGPDPSTRVARSRRRGVVQSIALATQSNFRRSVLLPSFARRSWGREPKSWRP